MNRRQFFAGASAAMATLGLPVPAFARTEAPQLKFLFVFAQGGWDPTRVFAPSFGLDTVDMEADAEPGTAGGLGFVDHPDRPSVRSFFERHHASSVIVNGVMVRSIAHEICTMIAMTGSSAGNTPDWPAIIAGDMRADFTLPHVVIGGPSFTGDDLGVVVARTGSAGQLDALISGDALGWSNEGIQGPNPASESLTDRYLARRLAARADAAQSAMEARLASDLATSHSRAMELKSYRHVMDFSGGAALVDQAQVAADALSLGLSRCATLSTAGSNWDTHANNDPQQSLMFENLFGGLGQLMDVLEAAPGTGGGSLAEQTVVIVMSEMGRTPMLNSFAGKDHWPNTSCLLIGPGLTGGRVVGSYDDAFYGRLVDHDSGELHDGGQVVSAESVGAALLELAGMDPSEWVPGASPLRGILS